MFEVDWFTAFLFARHCVSNHLFVLHTPSPLQLHRRDVYQAHKALLISKPKTLLDPALLLALMMGKNVAILMLTRTLVEKIQLVVVLVTHIIAVMHQHLWGALGAIVVPMEIARMLIVLRPLLQLLRQPSPCKNGLSPSRGRCDWVFH